LANEIQSAFGLAMPETPADPLDCIGGTMHDLVVDSKGGVYFALGDPVFHADPKGAVKKYGDDNGGVLVANLCYSAFISLFPLLLILVTILGLIASSNAEFRQDALDTVANQVPIIGHQLTGSVTELRRSSVIGLIVGLVTLVWGATGLAQAGLFTMGQVWNLPGPARPGFAQRLGRAVIRPARDSF